jgi:hypothetical protein
MRSKRLKAHPSRNVHQTTEPTMSTQQHIDPEAWKYAEKALTWYGWGSPVGISLFLISIGVFLVLLHHAGLLR